MAGLKENIEQTIEKITKTNECFYQQKNQEAIAVLEDTLSSIEKTVGLIYADENGKKELDLDGFMQALQEALGAMEDTDYVLMADIMQYDIIDKLEQVKNSL